MRNNLFRGVTTAMITPFLSDGSVDFDGLRRNTRHQIDNRINGLLPLGTTGEAPTLSEDEKEQVVRTVVEERGTNSDVKVMVGVGTNSTSKTIHNAQQAQVWGADALLVVTPYYNKPTQEGILAHFSAVCKETDLPVVVYNIKGRTGTNIETSTLKSVTAANEQVIAVKEASGDIMQMTDVLAQIPDLAVYSGDDGLTLPLLMLGGQGVISVVSNLLPKQIVDMVTAALDGNLELARQLHFQLLPIFKAAFIESNPGPIKYAMQKIGLAGGPLRLPLVEIRQSNRPLLDEVLTNLGL